MKTIRQLRILYFLIWIIPAALSLLYATGVLGERSVLFNARQEYILLLTGIVLAMADIYGCSKLFRFRFVIRTFGNTPEQGMKAYIRWNILRYCATILVTLLCLFAYMTTSAENIIYAALILVIASAFWYPSRQEQKFIANDR